MVSMVAKAKQATSKWQLLISNDEILFRTENICLITFVDTPHKA
jgi:hypothetical protein